MVHFPTTHNHCQMCNPNHDRRSNKPFLKIQGNVEPYVCLHSAFPNVSSFYRWLGEAPAQRAKEEEQAEASVSGPEPAQWPFGLCTQQSVRTEPTDFPLKRKRRKYKAKLLATAAATIFWLTWTVPTPSHQTSPGCPPGRCYTITIKK